MITILIADDHTMVRHGIRALLASDPELQVVGEAADGLQALALIEDRKPDVALIDISMPGASGVDVARAVRDARLMTGVVILSMHAEPAIVREALEVGARGYVLKEEDGDELLRVIREVARGGERVLGGGVDAPSPADASEALELLTDRERETVTLIACGLTSKEIGERLDLSTRTVEAYRASAMRKLGARSVAELTVYAVQRGLLRLL